jgi:hypothetical protein
MRAAIPFVIALALSGCGLVLDLDPSDPAVTVRDAGPPPPPIDASRGDSEAAIDAPPPVIDAELPPPADATIDAEVPPPLPDGCGGPSFVYDDFEIRDIPAWAEIQTMNGGTAGEMGGRLQIDLPAGTSGAGAGYMSRRWFDAREDGVAVEAFTPPGAVAATAEIFLALAFSEGTYAAIYRTAGGMRTAVFVDGMPMSVTVAERYDPVAHRWWSIAGLGGTLYFSTSPDGFTWTVLAERPMPDFMEGVRVAIGARTRTALATPLAAELDNLNLQSLAAHEPPCPIHSFTDRFEGGENAFRWLRHGDKGCQVRVDDASGSLAIQPLGGDCGLVTFHAYDANGDTVTLEVERGPASGDYVFSLALHDVLGSGRVEVTCSGTTGVLFQSAAGSSSSPFRCAFHPFWRLRHDPVSSSWSVEVAEGAGLPFMSLATLESSVDPRQVLLTMTAMASGPMPSGDNPLLLDTYNP